MHCEPVQKGAVEGQLFELVDVDVEAPPLIDEDPPVVVVDATHLYEVKSNVYPEGHVRHFF